jgi:hypothetical protein
MNRYFLLVMLAAIAIPASGADDHFPLKKGNTWLYDYTYHSGGEYTTGVDSGTIQWEIMAVDRAVSFPELVMVYIQQTKTIDRKKYHTTFPDAASRYDSLYVPPRIFLDTIVLTSRTGGKLLTDDRDSSWSILRDPAGVNVGGRLFRRDTIVHYQQKPCAAIVVDHSAWYGEQAGLHEHRYLITAPGVGIIEYHVTSPVLLVDFYSTEEWKLTWTNVVTTNARVPDRHRTVADAAPAQIHLAGKEVIIKNFMHRPGKITASFFLPTGALLGTYESANLSAGWHQTLIPCTSIIAGNRSKGVVIMKVEIPGEKTFGHVVRLM